MNEERFTVKDLQEIADIGLKFVANAAERVPRVREIAMGLAGQIDQRPILWHGTPLDFAVPNAFGHLDYIGMALYRSDQDLQQYKRGL